MTQAVATRRETVVDRRLLVKRALRDGVLDADVHARLLADLDHFAGIAGIPPEEVLRPLEGISKADLKLLAELRQWRVRDRKYGAVFVGEDTDPPMFDRMVALTAWTLRNFVDARLMLQSDLLDYSQDGELAPGTVIFCPDLMPAVRAPVSVRWKTEVGFNALLARQRYGLLNVLYTPRPLDELDKLIGPGVGKNLTANYHVIATH